MVSLMFMVLCTVHLTAIDSPVPENFASSRRKNSGENDAQLMVPAFSDYQASEMKM